MADHTDVDPDRGESLIHLSAPVSVTLPLRYDRESEYRITLEFDVAEDMDGRRPLHIDVGLLDQKRAIVSPGGIAIRTPQELDLLTDALEQITENLKALREQLPTPGRSGSA